VLHPAGGLLTRHSAGLGGSRLQKYGIVAPQKKTRPRRTDLSMVLEQQQQQPGLSTYDGVTVSSSSRSSIALPSHPDLVRGVLPNGLEYAILPNASPPGRFEAHLEVFAGSADEEDHQQGMAHLVEHVAYMGSRKRERLFGTGSQTNAYTDFHHTVFYACCPVEAPTIDDGMKRGGLVPTLLGGGGDGAAAPKKRRGAPMLPRALDALCEVLCAQFAPNRVEKERAAVLSEMSMVNTIEYRVECQILRALHAENALARRFPIGLEDQIKAWTVKDVTEYHKTHYRPDNALLYVVGDVDPKHVVDEITKAFGDVPVDASVSEKQPAAKGVSTLFGGGGGGGGGGATPTTTVVADGALEDAVSGSSSLKEQSRHFPPVLHAWSGGPYDKTAAVPVVVEDGIAEPATTTTTTTTNGKRPANGLRTAPTLSTSRAALARELMERPEVTPTAHPVTDVPVRAHVFQHEMLQTFSFHLFAKRPVEPVNSFEDHRLYVMRRVALAALQVRLNVMARDEPVFSFVEFNHLDSAREACAVCSLDMTADAGRWKDAVRAAVRETRRMGTYGITMSELERFSQALVTDSEQLAAMGDQLAHADQVTHLMETLACDHVFMDPAAAHAATLAAIDSITLEDVNRVAADLCAHVVDLAAPTTDTTTPSAIVACAPTTLSNGQPVDIDNAELLAVVAAAAAEPIAPEPELVVPKALMDDAEIAALAATAQRMSASVTDDEKHLSPGARNAARVGARAKTLGNGARVVVKSLANEAQRGAIRLTAAGGRSIEGILPGIKSGAVMLGARTLQEGGAFAPWTREQVELFCVDRLIMVEVTCTDEALFVDFQFPTPPPRSGGCGGLEAALQIAHKILEPGAFVWEADALDRARLGLAQQHETSLKSMEGAAQDALLSTLLDGDERFRSVAPDPDLTLEDVERAVMTLFRPDNVEVVVVGDFDADDAEQLADAYIGSVQPFETAETSSDAVPLADADAPAVPLYYASDDDDKPAPTADERLLRLHVADSDPRAVAYLAGGAPNRAGILADGRRLVDAVVERLAGSRASSNTNGNNGGADAPQIQIPERWRHPLFATVALALLQEVINRRLFSVVREKRQLTYDANFHLSDHDRLKGGWYLVSVTASPANADAALEACRDTLEALAAPAKHPPTRDNLESARRVVINRHLADLAANKYWCDCLAGVTFDSAPGVTADGLADFVDVANKVTVNDLVAILGFIDVAADHTVACVATSGADDETQGLSPTDAAMGAGDEHGRSHVSLRRR